MFPFSVCLWLYLRVRKQDEGRLSGVMNGVPALTLNLVSPGYFGFYERAYEVLSPTFCTQNLLKKKKNLERTSK